VRVSWTVVIVTVGIAISIYTVAHLRSVFDRTVDRIIPAKYPRIRRTIKMYVILFIILGTLFLYGLVLIQFWYASGRSISL
jgi:hypothetical protein